jgi:hypothetical protein
LIGLYLRISRVNDLKILKENAMIQPPSQHHKKVEMLHTTGRVYKGSMHKERNKPFVMYWVEHWNFEMTAPTASSFHMCKTA